MKISNLAPNVKLDADNPRGGINLHFDLHDPEHIQLSETWTIAGLDIRFGYLPSHQTLALEEGCHYLKVIVGKLANLGRGCFAEDFAVKSARLVKTQVLSGPDGLLFALVTETPELREKLHDMSECAFTGPMSEQLEWKSFEERFGAYTDYFNHLDNHMANGFHLLDSAGDEISYVNFWTCGKNGDVSTHNHAQDPSPLSPAFAEVHLVLYNGTGLGGMYEAESPSASERSLHVMQRGDEHGPFFEHRSGYPVLLDNGAVKYPWHGWQSGADDGEGQVYDLVAAFEINPAYALVQQASSTEMR